MRLALMVGPGLLRDKREVEKDATEEAVLALPDLPAVPADVQGAMDAKLEKNVEIVKGSCGAKVIDTGLAGVQA